MIGKSLLGFSLVILIAVFLTFDHANGQTVSPKLDFNDSKEVELPNSSTKRPLPSFNQQDDNDDEGGGGGGGRQNGGSNSGSGKTGPKIHGVRVTVDTGDNQRGAKESKESVEITDSKNKKKIGIHTDITFEITGDVDINSTSSSQRHDKEENDASVPIFKGRKGTTTHRPRKPYDPRSHWNPNFSAERRRSGGGDSSYRPSHYPHNIPVYPGVSSSNGDDIYRGMDSWSGFIPITSTWTTERSYYETYKPPNSVGGYRVPSWKPCYCASTSDNRRRRDNVAHPTSSIIQVVDKLDSPFSSGKK